MDKTWRFVPHCRIINTGCEYTQHVSSTAVKTIQYNTVESSYSLSDVRVRCVCPGSPGVFLPVPCETRLPPVSYRYRVSPGSARCLFTGTGVVRWWVWMADVRFVCVIRVSLCPVCVPAPPGVFLPVPYRLPPVSLNRYMYRTGNVNRNGSSEVTPSRLTVFSNC